MASLNIIIMDYTKSNRIRNEKDFNKIANDEVGGLFRKDSESIFTEMIKEKDLNHAECIIIREYLRDVIVNRLNGFYRTVNKTSYYNVAIELFDKLSRHGDFTSSILHEVTKRNKFNANELECFILYVASLVCLGVTIATLKNLS